MSYFEDFVPGQSARSRSLDVSQDDIVAFASRYDAQDFHVDPEAAKASFVGRLIGSGWHSCSLLMRLMAEDFLLDAASMGAPGIDEVKWLRPLLPGDSVSARRTVLETKASRSRPEMGLVRFKLELLNQRDEPILEQTNWIMFGRKGSGIGTHPAGPWLDHAPIYERPLVESPLENPAEPPGPPRFFEELSIGDSHELGSFVFTPEEIVAFARSFDPQPFHMDEAAARNSSFGRLAASGWHTAAVWMACMVQHRRRQLAAASDRPARLGPSPGFRNLRWTKPVFAGDRITYRSEVIDKRESASRPQWGLFFHRNTGTNQHGEEVFSFDGCVFVERKPS
ncbi:MULTISPECIES: MaoC family dehydratase [Bosea]|uniref:MaoC family dehydratase n=1 Tax=Bosea TaxID=85413 RepID=UPI0021504B77|nr:MULTISPECIES: MaoC family dehydratase [Bosea]MCR4520126.1 MaoC family dehydratase [Bosea sp. 47.2.35]MDR6829692.1 acyl dehydratase [Bosea robiniae]MDR6896575.1 acyl dehydratase [Bosea sp. BE109]MDR7139973.1 acyl dehydratase [Bosea sp. BE168]MDR7176713.1 acyl dehydratase [Bosea sp. BE271]